MQFDVHEIEEGGYNTSTKKFIGKNRYPNVILKKGINKNNELIHWFQRNQEGEFERKTMSVILKHPSGVEIKRWNLYRAFPCRWKVQCLDVNDKIFPIEIIEIVHE